MGLLSVYTQQNMLCALLFCTAISICEAYVLLLKVISSEIYSSVHFAYFLKEQYLPTFQHHSKDSAASLLQEGKGKKNFGKIRGKSKRKNKGEKNLALH